MIFSKSKGIHQTEKRCLAVVIQHPQFCKMNFYEEGAVFKKQKQKNEVMTLADSCKMNTFLKSIAHCKK